MTTALTLSAIQYTALDGGIAANVLSTSASSKTRTATAPGWWSSPSFP